VSEPKRYHHQAGLRSREVIDTGEDRDLNIMFADAYYEADAKRLCDRMNGYEDTIARLKAEVERLTLHIELDEVDRRNGLCCDAKYRFQELEEQVERLTKAGDAMASGLLGMAGERPKALADEWNEAKGVQS